MQGRRMLVIFLLFSLSSALLPGCWSRRELDEVAIVSAMGFDLSVEPPGQIVLTAQVIKPSALKGGAGGGSGSGGGGNDQKSFITLQAAGRTVAEAGRNLALQTSRRLFLAHIGAFVISEDAARQGVLRFIDFLVRDVRPRDFKPIFVSKDKASKVLATEIALAEIPAYSLTLIESAQSASGKVPATLLQEFHERLRSRTFDPTATLLQVVKDPEGKDKLVTAGTAVFRQDVFMGELDELATRGLLWIRGTKHMGYMVVQAADGWISLETIRVKSQVKPQMQQGRPSMLVEVEVTANMAGQTTAQDFSTTDGLEYMAGLAAEQIKLEMLSAVQAAQNYGADIFGFGAAFHRAYPKEREVYQQWDQIFPTLDTKYEVKTNVYLRGLIEAPPVERSNGGR